MLQRMALPKPHLNLNKNKGIIFVLLAFSSPRKLAQVVTSMSPWIVLELSNLVTNELSEFFFFFLHRFNHVKWPRLAEWKLKKCCGWEYWLFPSYCPLHKCVKRSMAASLLRMSPDLNTTIWAVSSLHWGDLCIQMVSYQVRSLSC